MRVLLATIGSLGDLHPCLGLGVELMRRGHTVTVATAAAYRPRIVELGLAFHELRPNWNPSDSDLIRQCEDLKTGPEVLFRRLVLPHLEESYHDLLRAARNCDLLLAGELVFAAPLVSEKLKLRWVSLILSPCSFLSAHDPSLLVILPQLILLRRMGATINRAILNLGAYWTRHWWEPVERLRRKEGLNPKCAPFTRDKFSPTLTLALFAAEFASKQPDWPPNTVQTGFTFYDGGTNHSALTELDRFLDAGEAPLVFTLGSTAVACPGNFYQASADAAVRLGKRAILLGIESVRGSSDILCLPYAPFSYIFPRASVVVHQGGSGTTGQAMRAGRPMLFVPFGWDQPDNAARVERLGAGLTVTRKDYSADAACHALKRLLYEDHFAANAAALGRSLSGQNGIEAACDAVEALGPDATASILCSPLHHTLD